MQPLFALRESHHQEADEKDHGGEVFREMATGGALEGDAISCEIGNFHAENHFAECGLVGRAFHERRVEPGTEEQENRGQSASEYREAAMWKSRHSASEPDPAEDEPDWSNNDTQDH